MATTTPTVLVDGTNPTKQSFVERKKEQVKAAAKAKTTELASTAKAETKSLLWRNRRQLVPIKAAAAVAATGSTAAVLAEHTELAEGAAFGAAGLVAAGGAWTVNKFKTKIPSDMTSRVKAGIAAGCLWCLGMPFVGVDEPAMWLGLGAATIGLSAKWWQRIRPGYPTGPAPKVKQEIEPETQPDQAPTSTALIIQRWNDTIASKNGVLPKAEISPPRTLKHGRAFPVQLDPGAQTLTDARNALNRIASGLRIPAAKLAIEEADPEDPSQVELRVIDRSPVLKGVAYQGPRIVTDDEGIHIALGPYADGDGDAKYTVFTEDSMRSGFIFGGTGAGKSRVVELIAIGLRKLGVEIWYLDPQEGQSSPALMELADWPLSGLGDDENPTGNVDKLLRAMERGMKYRSKRLAVDGKKGFTHTREMPGVMVIIEECSDVFNTPADNGVLYGAQFGPLSKKIRKNGMGILGVGHVYTLPTFGGDKMLRSSLTMYNLIALKTTEKSDASLLPSGMPDPTVLPLLPGFGYIKSVASPRVAQFRAEYVTDPERWLSELSGYGLDAGTANRIGDDYVRRHEIAEEQRQRLLRELEAYENGEIPDEGNDAAGGSRPTPSSGSVLALPLLGGNRENNPAAAIPTGDGAEVSARPLTQREQDLMSLLADGGEWHTNDMAEHLGVSPQRVRELIRGLETRLVKIRPGVYRAKHL